MPCSNQLSYIAVFWKGDNHNRLPQALQVGGDQWPPSVPHLSDVDHTLIRKSGKAQGYSGISAIHRLSTFRKSPPFCTPSDNSCPRASLDGYGISSKESVSNQHHDQCRCHRERGGDPRQRKAQRQSHRGRQPRADPQFVGRQPADDHGLTVQVMRQEGDSALALVSWPPDMDQPP